jgi:hypothetical protein
LSLYQPHERRCAECGYPAGSPSTLNRCSECGSERMTCPGDEDAARSNTANSLRIRVRWACFLAFLAISLLSMKVLAKPRSVEDYLSNSLAILWLTSPIIVAFASVELTSRLTRARSLQRSPGVTASLCFGLVAVGVSLLWISYEVLIAPAVSRGARRPSTSGIVFMFIPLASVALGAIAAVVGCVANWIANALSTQTES